MRASVRARERLLWSVEHGADRACGSPEVHLPEAEVEAEAEEQGSTAVEWRQSAQGKVFSTVTECGFPNLLRFFFVSAYAPARTYYAHIRRHMLYTSSVYTHVHV